MSHSATPPGFDTLLTRYPWPSEPPYPGLPVTGRDSRGFALIEHALHSLGKEAPVVLEIGSEFGGSTRRFLSAGAFVVSVDPWQDVKNFNSFPHLKQFRGVDGAVAKLFQTFNFEHRDRLVAVQEFSPAGPIIVKDAGVEVDLVYIDGDHRYDAVIADLETCAALFPTAVLTGDDWTYDRGAPEYEGITRPVQTAVRRWAQHRDMAVESQRNSWLIDPTRPYNRKPVRPVVAGPSGRRNSAPLPEDRILARLRETNRRLDRIEGSLNPGAGRRALRKMQTASRRLLPKRT